MALRCLLVSLVATLGFELPSGQDVTSWTMSGQSFVAARAGDVASMGSTASGWLGLNDSDSVAKLIGPTLAAESAQVVASAETAAATSSADLAFESVGEGTVLTFADDILAAPAGVETPLPATEVEPVMVAAADAEPIIVAAADAEPIIVAVTEPVCQPETNAMNLAFPAAEAELATEESEQVEESDSVVAEQLSSAVQLTRDAVQAWTSLVQSVGSEMVLTR